MSVGVLKAGYRYNVIADTALLDCTVRTLDIHTRQLMQDRIEQIVEGITKAMGARYEMRYVAGYPPAANCQEQVNQVVQASEATLGSESVTWFERPSLTGEDFAHFLEHT
ncbi:MAG TPA: amidohydrolase, partial [Firmicutes bacterium]|nr:amidohydrolase [Bacillota bacterium]